MTSPTFAQATTALPIPQIRDGMLTLLSDSGSIVGGLPTSSPDRGLIEGEASYLAYEQQVRVGVALSMSATTAAQAGSSWVDAAATWFQVPNGTGGFGRIQATFATWSIGVVCAPTAAPITLQPGELLQVQAADSAHSIFNAVVGAPITLNVGSSYKASVTVIARLAGTVAGNVGATNLQNGAIISTVHAGLNVDASVLPTVLSAAIDQESDAALIARCLASWSRLGAGWTKQSFDYLIPLLAPDVNRWLVDDSNPFGPGSIGITLATASGPASGPSSTPGTDCYKVLQGLTAPSTKPIGSGPVIVQPATAHPLTLTFTVVGDGTNPNLQTNISDAFVALGAVYPIFGSALALSLLEGIIMGAAYAGPVAVIVGGDAPPFPTSSFVLNLPGFSGIAAISAFTSSTGNLEATGFEPLSPGDVLEVTTVITVVT